MGWQEYKEYIVFSSLQGNSQNPSVIIFENVPGRVDRVANRMMIQLRQQGKYQEDQLLTSSLLEEVVNSIRGYYRSRDGPYESALFPHEPSFSEMMCATDPLVRDLRSKLESHYHACNLYGQYSDGLELFTS